MLSVFLACDDPHLSAEDFTALGWSLEFATPPDVDPPVAAVRLGDARVMLGVADERYLAAAEREHRGAGVEVYVGLVPELDIAEVHERHAAGGAVTDPLATRPWGERAFHARIAGYKFLVAQEAGAAE